MPWNPSLLQGNFAAIASFRNFGRKKGAAVRKPFNAAPLRYFI
jgi:hypothetical protein